MPFIFSLFISVFHSVHTHRLSSLSVFCKVTKLLAVLDNIDDDRRLKSREAIIIIVSQRQCSKYNGNSSEKPKCGSGAE